MPGLIEQVETTLSESQVSMEEAMGKLNAIDVDALNQAIQDLAAVVAPLASLAGKFS